MRKLNKVIIHCSYTPEGREHDVDDIRAWHKAQGWSDVGYHFIIKLDGTIEAGRPITKIGAHCKGYNQGSIGICYIGGMDKTDRSPKDTRTESQKESIVNLVNSLNTVFGELSVHGHNEFSSKACPCFDVKEEFYS